MNAGDGHKCTAVSAEDLLLYAYGEADEPRIAGHVAQCPECRAFLADLARVRDAAQRAGMLEPGMAVVAGLKSQAEREIRTGAAARTKQRQSAWPRWAMAAAAVLVAAVGIMIYRAERTPRVPAMARERGVPAYLEGVGGEISELESQVGDSVDAGAPDLAVMESGDSVMAQGDFSLDPGAWDLIEEQGPDVGDLEIAMNDLESQVDLLGYDEAQDSGAVELPMLHGFTDKASL